MTIYSINSIITYKTSFLNHAFLDKRDRANSTYLLALDGDMDFLPDAVIKVIRILGRICVL